MKREWADYIVCPECHGSLNLSVSEEKDGRVVTGSLECGKHVFSVSGGIPRLLPLIITGSQKSTQESFSSKWTRSKEIKEYGHDEGVKNFQIDWYIDRYGWESKNQFDAFLSKQYFTLDAGCGVGRDTKWHAEHVAGVAFGIDIGESIDIAKANLEGVENAFLIQGDISRPPFKEEFFDYISCDQVLHHTPNTRDTFMSLASCLKRGGKFATYTYKVKGPIREFSDDFIRSHATNMSPDECYELSRQITNLAKALSDLRVEVDIPEDIPLLKIKKGPMDIQRFIYWHMFKCFWNDDFGMERSIMTNYDWYHPKDAHRHNADEVRTWINEAGLQVIHFHDGHSGISIVVKKD